MTVCIIHEGRYGNDYFKVYRDYDNAYEEARKCIKDWGLSEADTEETLSEFNSFNFAESPHYFIEILVETIRD